MRNPARAGSPGRGPIVAWMGRPSVAVIVARDRWGALVLLGLSEISVARATEETVRVSVAPSTIARLPRGPVTADALLFPADGDTAPAILSVELARGR